MNTSRISRYSLGWGIQGRIMNTVKSKGWRMEDLKDKEHNKIKKDVNYREIYRIKDTEGKTKEQRIQGDLKDKGYMEI